MAQSAAAGFDAMKLKVGSADIARDVRRARVVREAAGTSVRLVVDANQQRTVAEALRFAEATRDLDLFWFEEPTHPDDVLGHQKIAGAVAPVRVAAGEHVPNRIVFKNYLQAGAIAVSSLMRRRNPAESTSQIPRATVPYSLRVLSRR